MVARDIGLAELTGGRLHIAHASTAGTVELIRRAKANGERTTCEVTPHHLTLTEEAVLGVGSDPGSSGRFEPLTTNAYDSNAKVSPAPAQPAGTWRPWCRGSRTGPSTS